MKSDMLEKKIGELQALLASDRYIVHWRHQRHYLHTWLAIHEHLELIADVLFEYSTRFSDNFDLIAAMGRSGLPIATALALKYEQRKQDKPMIFVSDPSVGVRSQWDPPVKPYLKKDDLMPQARVMMVDTVLRTGYTAEDAAIKLMNHSLKPEYVLVLADYENVDNGPRASVEAILKKGVKIERIFYLRPVGEKFDPSWLTSASSKPS